MAGFTAVFCLPILASEERRTAFDAALERSDLPAAWSVVSAWKEAAATDPRARMAEAQLYLRLNAPAAAIASADDGLERLTEATRALELPLLGLKAQAHAAAGEPAAAWAAYSRLVARARPEQQGDALVATARRARWESLVQLSTTDSYERFFERITATAATPGAPASAHVDLARWLHLSQGPEVALQRLAPALAAQPESPELRAAFADLFLTAAIATDQEEFAALHQRYAASLAGLRQGVDADPLATLALSLLREYHEHDKTPAPPRQAPKDFAAATRTFTASLAMRRPRLIAQIEPLLAKLEEGSPQFEGVEEKPPTLADILAWEKKQLETLQVLWPARAELLRLEEASSFIYGTLKERVTPGTATAEEKAAFAELDKVPRLTEDQQAALQSSSSWRDRLAMYVSYRRKQRRADSALERVAAATTPAGKFAATDAAIAAGDTSVALWRARLEAAQALGDHAEALAIGARAFVAEWLDDEDLARALPAPTQALLETLEKQAGGAAALVAQAGTTWEAGKPAAAFSLLDQATTLDPALPAAWRQRWQWSEAGGDHAGAALAFTRWWQLDEREPHERTRAFDIASRAGAWELMLSLAEARLATDPGDMEALYFHAHAAAACNRNQTVGDTLRLLQVSPHADAARPLEFTQYLCGYPTTLSNDTLALSATPSAPPLLAMLRACHDHRLRKHATHPTPAAKSDSLHVERLAGRLTPAEYLAKTRDTPEEPLAAFVTFFAVLASNEKGSPESWALARALAADPSLPLALRAFAHSHLVESGQVRPQPSLRARDLHYAVHAPPEAWWGAPGQEVVPHHSANLALVPATQPLRLRYESRGFFELPTPDRKKDPATRLIEVTHAYVSGDLAKEAAAARRAPILIARDVASFEVARLDAAGFVRIERGKVDGLALNVARGATVELENVTGSIAQAAISGRLRLTGGSLRFQAQPKLAAGSSAELRAIELRGDVPFALETGATCAWHEVAARCDMPWPSPLPAGWSIQRSRIAAPVSDATAGVIPLPAPHSGQLLPLASARSAPTHEVKTAEELVRTVRYARPGAKIHLAAGEYTLAEPLLVPPGVTITAAKPNQVFTDRSSSGAFVFSGAGARALTGINNNVALESSGANSFFVDHIRKTGLTVGDEAWVFVEDGYFLNWSHPVHTLARIAKSGRLELRNHNTLPSIMIEPGGQLITGDPQLDPRAVLRAALVQRSRTEQWEASAGSYTLAIAAATDRGAREAATRRLGDSLAATAARTGATPVEATRRYMEIVVPVLLRHPAESPYLLHSSDRPEVNERQVLREMLPDSLRQYFQTFANSFNEAQRIGLSKVSTDNVYNLTLAHPPGSAHYGAAQKAKERNLTVAEFEKELVETRKREATLAAALKTKREEDAKRRAADAKRAKAAADAAAASRAANTASTPRWTPNSYTPAPSFTPPAWTPSQSFLNQIYRHNLNVQIYKATRGY